AIEDCESNKSLSRLVVAETCHPLNGVLYGPTGALHCLIFALKLQGASLFSHPLASSQFVRLASQPSFPPRNRNVTPQVPQSSAHAVCARIARNLVSFGERGNGPERIQRSQPYCA